MQVRPRILLGAEQITSVDQALEIGRSGVKPLNPTHKYVPQVGDWVITPPNGERFARPAATFAEDYELIEPGKSYLRTPDGVTISWDGMEPTPTSPFTFGVALQLLKKGRCVARAGWNGKGMFLFLGKDVTFNIEPYWAVAPVPIDVIHNCIVMKNAKGGELVPGWPASQTDMLAEDWELVS